MNVSPVTGPSPKSANVTPSHVPAVVLSATSPSKSAPASPTQAMDSSVEVDYRERSGQRGFFEGLLGCLRPVWTIIGKATQAELKSQGKGYIL